MTTANTDTGDTHHISTDINITAATGATASAADVAGAAAGGLVALAPREALITTAVNFLQNSKVRHTTLMQKQQFLRSKGLTADEIQLACERAGVFSQDPNAPNAPTVINMGVQSRSQLALQPRQSAYVRIKELLQSVALLSGVAYAIYVFWKKYVEPFLFGKKKKKPIADALQDIDTKVDTRINEVNRELSQIKDTLAQQQREQTQQFNREFSTFRSDLEAIKGLLLNRKQFASPLTAVSGASIPAWQLSSSPHHRHSHRHSESQDELKADDAGSASGSSETEVVTKNSDSSLEIM